jgi:V/A-type H+/Na+-transporting ATPase subunit E
VEVKKSKKEAIMAKKKKETTTPQEAGVNEFIRRLRKKGVDEGKYRATEIVKEAEEKAKKIVAKAQKDADKLVATAKAKSTKMENSAKDSIKTAFRDASLELQTAVQDDFIKELRKIVKKEVSDKKMIKQMILKIVENATSKDKKEILISDPVKDGDKVKASVYGITQAMLKDGLVLKHFASPDKAGIIIKEGKKGLEVDLTDKAIADLLVENLLPVYRDLLSENK